MHELPSKKPRRHKHASLVDPAFRDLLEPEDLEALSTWAQTVYAVWEDRRLAFVNDAWFQFAADNGASEAFFERWTLGQTVESVFQGPAADKFETAMDEAFRSGQPTFWLYECSAPLTLRFMHATLQPLSRGGRRACLIHHTVVTETPLIAIESARSRDQYANADGLVVMCSACRSVRVPGEDTWERVQSLIAEPGTNVSHSLCPGCLSWYGAPMHVEGLG